MSLVTLERFDSQTANAVLAAAALATSPQPRVSESDAERFRDDVALVLKEIRSKLRIADGDSSPKATLAIDDYLSKAIDDVVLRDVKIDDVLSRAGQAGRLAPSLYRVVQPPEFSKRFKKLGVKEHYVQQAIHAPDDVQHLMTDLALPADEETFSLFAKEAPYAGTGSKWLLVQAHRNGVEQIAQSAWWIFSDEIDLSHVATPIDLLRAFTAVLGIEIQVGDKKGKLIEAVTFPRGEGNQTRFNVQLLEQVLNHFGSVSQRNATVDPNIFQVGIAYFINMDKYVSYLKRHGISA